MTKATQQTRDRLVDFAKNWFIQCLVPDLVNGADPVVGMHLRTVARAVDRKDPVHCMHALQKAIEILKMEIADLKQQVVATGDTPDLTIVQGTDDDKAIDEIVKALQDEFGFGKVIVIR